MAANSQKYPGFLKDGNEPPPRERRDNTGLFENDFVKKSGIYKRREKKCSHCKVIKPNQEFYSTVTGGLSYHCKPCEDKLSRQPQKIKTYNLYAVPSVNVTKCCPCGGCSFEKPCRILELSCPKYRRWQKGESYKKYPQVPDKHLDGSTPGPGVV